MLEYNNPFSSDYRGKVEFCHFGKGMFICRDDVNSSSFCPLPNIDYLEVLMLAYKALERA